METNVKAEWSRHFILYYVNWGEGEHHIWEAETGEEWTIKRVSSVCAVHLSTHIIKTIWKASAADSEVDTIFLFCLQKYIYIYILMKEAIPWAIVQYTITK